MYIRRFFLSVLFAAVVLTASGNALADKYRVAKEVQYTLGGAWGTSWNLDPAVAYNCHQNEYLLVWYCYNPYSKNTNISASRVSPNGSKTHLGVVSTANVCTYPDVAYDPINGRYLIVWSQYNADASRWEIYGRIIPWDSLGTSTPFPIASWDNLHLQIPAVAFGYNQLTGIYRYMVVWQTTEAGSGFRQGIGRRPVSADGVPLGFAAYVDSGFNEGVPDITFNLSSTQFLVVWEAPTSSTGIDIFGRRLGLDGNNEGDTFPINSDVCDDQRPALTTNIQHRYLVVWQHDYACEGTDGDIRGQFLDTSGGKVDEVKQIAATYGNETNPSVAASGGIEEYLTVWQKETVSGKGISGRLLYTDLSMSSSFVIVPPGYGDGDNKDPAAGCHNSGYFVAYPRFSFDSSIYADIYGRMLLEPGVNPGLWLLLLGN